MPRRAMMGPVWVRVEEPFVLEAGLCSIELVMAGSRRLTETRRGGHGPSCWGRVVHAGGAFVRR